ncbi:MAG TPA: hypothetical protein V6D20_06795, partial [Candidatus Obscuribacterales bacterium]
MLSPAACVAVVAAAELSLLPSLAPPLGSPSLPPFDWLDFSSAEDPSSPPLWVIILVFLLRSAEADAGTTVLLGDSVASKDSLTSIQSGAGVV